MSQMPPHSRRQVIASAVGVSVALAGCLGGADDDEDDGVTTDAGGRDDDDGDGDTTGADGPQLNGLVLDSGFPVQLIDPETDERVADVHYHDSDDFSHWHNMPLSIPEGEHTRLEVRVLDSEGEDVSLGDDGQLQFAFEPTSDTPHSLIDIETDGRHLFLSPTRFGDGIYEIIFSKDGAEVWTSPALEISID